MSSSRTKTIVNGTPPISLFLVDPDSTGIAFAGPFYYSSTTLNTLTDISSFFVESSGL